MENLYVDIGAYRVKSESLRNSEMAYCAIAFVRQIYSQKECPCNSSAL